MKKTLGTQSVFKLFGAQTLAVLVFVLWVALASSGHCGPLDTYPPSSPTEEAQAALGVIGLPIHAAEDLKSLKGPNELIPGEYVIWRYPFNWNATSATGQQIPLTKGNSMRFIGRFPGGFTVASNGVQYKLRTPPNVLSEGNLFMLVELRLTGVSAEIVKNRLGPPTKVIKDANGTAFLYDKVITRAQTSFDTVQSTTSGTIGTDRFNSTTTSTVPRSKSVTYSPWSFMIHFDSEGNVEHIDDLVEGAVKR